MPRACLPLLIAVVGAAFTVRAADKDVPSPWAMYFGGPGFEDGRAVATAGGNFYVVGSSSSSPGLPGQFLLKFNSAGTLLYTVAITGRAYDVATGPGGSAFIVASRQLATEVYAMKVTSSGSIEYIADIPGLAINFSGFERPAIAAGTSGDHDA